MKHIAFILVCCIILFACKNDSKNILLRGGTKDLDGILSNYWEQRMELFPLEATANGYNRYNDRMTITIAANFRDSLKGFYKKYLNQLAVVDSSKLDREDKLSYSLFKYELDMGLDGLKYPAWYMPVNQFWSLTLDLPQLGSGKGNQPFKSVMDYDNFLKRLSVFPAWTDTAIANMRLGMKAGWVLPRALVIKVLPQLKAMMVKTPEESIFYAPVKSMPDSFSAENKARLKTRYLNAIDSTVIPAYAKLYNFMAGEYISAARTSSGVGALPGGKEYYNYCVRYWTTTNLTPDSIYQLGLNEVARIEKEMIEVKDKTGFKGSLKEFFTYLNTNKKFFPFKTPQQVIDSFWNIKKQEDPQLKKLFDKTPKSQFTIRQTEAFRAASASAEYNPPSEDGSRPGIFYVPILDAKKYNAVGMVTLFLHEAIPGHHYQICLQQENRKLPEFRRFLGYGAYQEGWALYAESLGKELGVYDNVYQYFGHLSDEILRAVRLVVDVGIHYKGMTREQAIAYMVSHERITVPEATAEVERYMAIPGQALSYKIGQLTISAERDRYTKLMGRHFNIATFHDEVLNDGCLPMNILDEKLAAWAKNHNK